MSSPKNIIPPSNDLFSLLMVREFVNNINNDIKKMELEGRSDPFDFELEIMSKYPEFYDSHPFLVKKLCKRDDMTMLYKMIDSLTKVEEGTKSLASVELSLGEELADKYLYPVVGKKNNQ
jgi:hypothetical protein